MTSFQGYARRSSVSENTIKVEDPSKKILAEGQRTLSQWRARSSNEQASREKYLSALRNNFNKEQAIRDSNRRLEKEFAEDWKNAQAKNWEIRIQNAEGEAKNAAPPMLQQLAELAPTLAKTWNQIDEKRRKDGMELGNQLGWEHGVSMQDVWAYDKIKNGQLSNTETNLNAFKKELRDKGIPDSVIEQLGSLSGYQRLGIAEADLIRGAQNYNSWYWEQTPRELDLPGGEKGSLGNAVQSRNPKKLASVNRALLKEYLGKYSKYDQTLVQKHLRDPIIRAQGRMKTHQSELIEKSAKETHKLNLERDFKNSITIDSVEGYFGFVKRHEGQNGEFRKYANDLAHNTHRSLLESGRGNEEFLQRLLNHEYVPHGEEGNIDPKTGEPKKVKWSERNWRKAAQLKESAKIGRKKNSDASDAEIANFESGQKAIAFDVQNYITENYDKLTQKDYAAMFNLAVQTGNKFAQDKIEAARNVTPSKLNDKFNVPGLQTLYNNNMLTMSAVMNAKLTPTTEGDWIKKAKEQDKTKPSDETDKLFKTLSTGAIEGILKKYNAEMKNVPSAWLAQSTAHNNLRRYYKKWMIKTNDPDESRDQAIKELNADLLTDEFKITERRSIGGVLIQEPHFGAFQLKASRSPYPMTKLREEVRLNPNIWQEKVIGDERQTIQYAHNIAAGINKGFPAFYTHFVNDVMGRNPDGTTKVTEAEVFRHQLELIVGKEKAKELLPDELFDVARQAEDFIDPEFRKLLGLGPQGIAVATHYSKQTQANNYKPKEVKGKFNVFASGSIYREPHNLSDFAKFYTLIPETKSYAHPVLKEREANPGPLGSRSNPWPEGTPAWQIGGFNSEADYNEALKKDPSIKEILE